MLFPAARRRPQADSFMRLLGRAGAPEGRWLLAGRARDVTVRAEDTTVIWLWLKDSMTGRAFEEMDAGVRGHDFVSGRAAHW